MLDVAAKRAYRRRLAELRDELAEAEGFNDAGRAERVRAEIECLTEQLAAAVGLGGRDRLAASAAERARSTVQQAIRKALKNINTELPVLGDHLAARIKIGAFCVYRPDAADRWGVLIGSLAPGFEFRASNFGFLGPCVAAQGGPHELGFTM